uniref:Putative DNA binding, helix-turn-helix domain containing protein n=2 Tax=viral metagenome TaxID=1070528 RepID=A0A6M3L8I7_9ZZZZ
MKIKMRKIREECNRIGWGVKRLATESGVSRQTIYNLWETPEKFNPDTINKIAKALDVDPKDLIT